MSASGEDAAIDRGDSGLARVVEHLWRQGIEAGEHDGERLRERARAEAESVRQQAREEAAAMVAAADEEARRRRAELGRELRAITAAAALQLRGSLERSVLVPVVDEALARVLEDPEWLGALLCEAVRAFGSSHRATELEVLLPAEAQARLSDALLARITRDLGQGVRVRFDDELHAGLRVAGAGVTFDLSDDALRELLLRFASPRMRAALHGATEAP